LEEEGTGGKGIPQYETKGFDFFETRVQSEK